MLSNQQRVSVFLHDVFTVFCVPLAVKTQSQKHSIQYSAEINNHLIVFTLVQTMAP